MKFSSIDEDVFPTSNINVLSETNKFLNKNMEKNVTFDNSKDTVHEFFSADPPSQSKYSYRSIFKMLCACFFLFLCLIVVIIAYVGPSRVTEFFSKQIIKNDSNSLVLKSTKTSWPEIQSLGLTDPTSKIIR
jgi:type IV secretory pathway component VirB8